LSAVPGTTRLAPPGRGVEIDLRELWAYRELLYFFVWRDLKVRYQQTVIGVAWVIVQPVLSTFAFSLLFGRLAGLPSDQLPYTIFYFAGLLPWTYFSQSATRATNTLVDNQRVITKVYFPRILLPIAAVLAGLVDFAIGFAVLAALLPFYAIVPTAALWTLPLFVALTIAAALAVGFWLSALNALYRDVRYVVQFLLTFWMFVSPVAYPSSLVPEQWRWLYGLNPMAGAIDGVRWALGAHHPPGVALLAASCAAVLALLVGGVIYFQRVDQTVADVV
jgi:lipopolysaccharide transport system permease protein